MIKINVSKKKQKSPLIEPHEMLNSPHGTVFQQYFHGKPDNTFYVSCGTYEPSLITIWYSDEEQDYMMSTEDLRSLRELNPTVKAKKIKATVSITLEF